MVFVGVLNVVAGILWIIFFRDKGIGDASKEKPNVLENFKKVFKVKDVWFLAIFYGLNMAGLMTVIALLPITLTERGVERAGEAVSIMMGTTVVFNVLGGMLSDKVGKRKPFLIISSVLFGLCVIPFAVAKGAPLIVALIVGGACVGTVAPVLMSLPVEIEGVGHMLTATAVGLIFMVGNSGGFVGPVVSGKLMDLSGSHLTAFIAMAIVLVVAAGFILPMKETGRKREEGEASPPLH
jgi:cyanate permease